jgi:hypothetical protein
VLVIASTTLAFLKKLRTFLEYMEGRKKLLVCPLTEFAKFALVSVEGSKY